MDTWSKCFVNTTSDKEKQKIGIIINAYKMLIH